MSSPESGGGFLILRNQNVANPDDEVHAKASEVYYDLDGGNWSESYNASDHDWRLTMFTYSFTLPERVDVIAPIGYDFIYWYCFHSSGFDFKKNNNYSPGYEVRDVKNTNSCSFKAVYTPISYKVAFDSNGGSGSMSNQSFVYDTGQNLKSNTFTKTGYHFLGWATTSSGSVVYYDGQYVNNLSGIAGAVVTLYAVWEANTYKVSYNFSGALGTKLNQTFVYDIEQELTANVFINAGCIFMGWATTQENADIQLVAYEDCETVSNLTAEENGVVTLYAVWKIRSYYVEFNSNGGVGTMPRQEIENEVLTSLSANTFTKTGYTFVGWATTQNGVNNFIIKYADEEKVINLTNIADSVVTLYAVWSGVEYYVIYNGNGGVGCVSNQVFKNGKVAPLNPNGFVREGYKFLGWATSQEDADAQIVSFAEYQLVSNLALYEGDFVVMYAVWEKQYTAKYDSANGYWYVEVGRTPQKRVGGLLNAKLNAATLTLSGNSYKVSKTITLNGYLYQGEEYCVYNNQWYHVDPIRWRIEGSHAAGEYVDVAQRAILSSIVYFSEYSTSGSIYDVSVADAFFDSLSHSDENVNNLSTFIVSDLSGQNSKMYIASESEIGEIAGTYAVEFSDLVFDILHERFYYTRTPANDGNIRVYHGIADELASASAPGYQHGIQFVVSISNFVCL